MSKTTKQTIALTLGGLGALGFILLGMDLLPRDPTMAGAMVCVVLSGVVWALPARED